MKWFALNHTWLTIQAGKIHIKMYDTIRDCKQTPLDVHKINWITDQECGRQRDGKRAGNIWLNLQFYKKTNFQTEGYQMLVQLIAEIDIQILFSINWSALWLLLLSQCAYNCLSTLFNVRPSTRNQFTFSNANKSVKANRNQRNSNKQAKKRRRKRMYSKFITKWSSHLISLMGPT